MKKKLKAVLFDMDGVLFNSMPYHSEAWHKVMKSHGLTLSREEAYMHEGRTGAATINIVFQRELGREATQEEIESIYQEKSVLFNSYAEAERMPGAWELLQKVKGEGLTPMVVTGSGQLSLLERLEHNFPGMFHKELMVTAFDVKYGKPNPEPYLMALKKGGLKADEAVVVENAPLGVEAGHKAGIFTIAVTDRYCWTPEPIYYYRPCKRSVRLGMDLIYRNSNQQTTILSCKSYYLYPQT